MCEKKIALMTWHHTENYGTAFQAYALKKLIESLGYDVDLIDYRRKDGHILRRLTFKYVCNVLFHEIKKKLKQKKKIFVFSPEIFGDFYSRYFTYTHYCRYNQDFEDLNAQYHGFVCGSDQVWGPEWYDARYFLDFVHDQRRMIAYAPSIGVAKIEDGEIAEMMKGSISRFPYISLREETGCEAVRVLTGRNDVVNVLDPVIMLSAEDLAELEDKSELPSATYCLIFYLKNNEHYFKTALRIASQKHLSPCVMHCTQSDDTRYANVGGLTPGQLLSYIKNASYICTDSFHITVLSIVYQKQFLTFKKNASDKGNSKNNRITDLLKILGITGGEFDGHIPPETLIDYVEVNKVLIKLRSESLSYLSQALTSLPDNFGVALRQNCWIDSRCEGEQCQVFKNIVNCNNLESLFLRKMNTMPFTLEDKCYRCKCYNNKFSLDDSKPQFSNKLKSELSKSSLNIIGIYLRYYLPYYIINKIRRKK